MKNILLAIIIVITMQFTDYHVFSIKVGDIISLITIIFFITAYKYVPFPRVYPLLTLVFTLCFGMSFVTLSWIRLFPPSNVLSLLKSPGWISLSRYVQYLGCVFFALFIHAILYKKSPFEQKNFLLLIDHIMFGFGAVFLMFWALGHAGINSPFIYADDAGLSPNRLAGGFVEGGPFGLLYAFYTMVRFRIFGVSIRWLLLVTFIIIASESKAGTLFFLIALVYQYVVSKQASFGARLGFLLVFALVAGTMTQLFDFTAGLSGYQENFEQIDKSVTERPDDKSLVMGRIAASSIGTRMFKDNMLVGVGFGNYSLARNNPEYLGIFPAVAEWDLSGLGGIATYGIESGVIGVVLLLTPLIMLWIKLGHDNGDKTLLAFFVLAQLLGVQLYFQYPWLVLGIVTAFKRQTQTDITRIHRMTHKYVEGQARLSYDNQ